MAFVQRSAMNGSSGLANLLRQRGFIELVTTKVGKEESYYADYGPLGTLLRQNIFKNWWDLMVASQSNVFPVQSPIIPTTLPVHNSSSSDFMSDARQSLKQDCAAKYPQILKLTNGKLPISIASVGSCFSPKSKYLTAEAMEEQSLLLGSAIETKLTLQNYIAPSNANAIHDFWLQTRLSWWKNFSRSPERFSVISNCTNGNGVSAENNSNGLSESYMSIVYQFPWGQEVVESVNNLGDQLLRHVFQNEVDEYMIKSSGKKAFLPSCIECDTTIESAMAAWLIDAYDEKNLKPTSGKKSSRSKSYQVLRLHNQISPYQVSIVITSPSSSPKSNSTGVEMRYICDNLERNLRKAGVSVFNASSHGGALEAHFRRNDQLGVPYTVIINQNTVTDGLVSTRSRDTQVKVQSHISSVVAELSRNLRAKLE